MLDSTWAGQYQSSYVFVLQEEQQKKHIANIIGFG